MRALYQTDGSVAWKFAVGPAARGKTIFTSPAVFDGVLCLGAYDGNGYALHTAPGAPRWENGDADWVGSSPAIAGDRGLVFIGLEFALPNKRGGIVALDLKTGEKKWEYHDMADYTHSSPAYIGERGLVIAGNNDGSVYCFDASSGSLQWEIKTGGAIKASFAYDGDRNLIFFGSFDKSIYAVVAVSAAIKFRIPADVAIFSTPTVSENKLFAGSTDKYLYAVNLDTENVIGKFLAGGRILSTPLVANGSIYFGATDGKMYEISRDTGKLLGSFQATERVTNSILRNPRTGLFFLPTYANEIYCLKKSSE